jgi:hypothetical protein
MADLYAETFYQSLDLSYAGILIRAAKFAYGESN